MSTNNTDTDSASARTPTEEQENSTAAAAAAAPSNRQTLGYCHVCDRQVPIDNESFTCSVCNGGFIELLESPAPAATDQAQNQRIFTTQLPTDGSLMSMLPLLLPQLLGQMGQQPMGQMNIRTHVPGDQDQSRPNAQPQQSATQLQFIVPNSQPGGQVDLYGIINNVLSDLMRPPGSTPGQPMPNPLQFHFQSPPIRMFQLHGDMRDYAWGEGGLDTIITQLLNQLTNTGPPPATQDQVINLPVVKINEEDIKKNLECAICFEDFQLNEEAKKLPCKHCFHEPCITEWLKLHGTCPVCRKDLTGEDTSQREYVSRPPPPGSAEAEAAMDADTPPEASTTPAATNNTEQAGSRANSNNPEVYHDMEFD